MAVAQSEEDKGGQVPARSTAASRLAARRAAKASAKQAKKGTAPLLPTKLSEGVDSAKTWFDEHQRKLLIGLVVVVVVIAVWPTLAAQFNKSHREAGDSLIAALTTANAPIIPAGSEPAGDAPEESFPTLQARAEKAREAFAATAKRFPDSPAATWAKLGEANALAQLGKQADAQKIYASMADRTDLDPFVQAHALEGLGYALAAQQKYDEAAKRFAQMGAIDNGAYKVPADYQQARMQIALGNKQKAADILQALVKAERARPAGEGTRFESVVSDAELLLTELSVELNAPKLRADIPSASSQAGAAPGSQQGTGLTQDIIDALRKQLESGKGADKGLTKDVVDQLEKQMKSGSSTGTTVKIPAPAHGAPSQAPAGQAPAGKDAPR
jgi:tetratricopeptide (TPR) repeat protein